METKLTTSLSSAHEAHSPYPVNRHSSWIRPIELHADDEFRRITAKDPSACQERLLRSSIRTAPLSEIRASQEDAS